MFTHKNKEALEGGELFARVTYRVINGEHPSSAIENVAVSMSSFIQNKVKQAIAKVDEVTDVTSSLSQEQFADDLAIASMARLWDIGRSEPIRVGKASPTEGTLPGSVYFILKYSDHKDGLNLALQANAMVGVDNASRSIAIGMVLGAFKGVGSIHKKWLFDLEQYEYCEKLLNKLPLLKSES
jgi:ADP-ribosylglycohydrolase